jgi:hypothetical protein
VRGIEEPWEKRWWKQLVHHQIDDVQSIAAKSRFHWRQLANEQMQMVPWRFEDVHTGNGP